MRDDTIEVAFEKVDEFLTVFGRCFVCCKIFATTDIRLVRIESSIDGERIRFHLDCYNRLCVALSLFNENIDYMTPQTSRIQ